MAVEEADTVAGAVTEAFAVAVADVDLVTVFSVVVDFLLETVILEEDDRENVLEGELDLVADFLLETVFWAEDDRENALDRELDGVGVNFVDGVTLLLPELVFVAVVVPAAFATGNHTRQVTVSNAIKKLAIRSLYF